MPSRVLHMSSVGLDTGPLRIGLKLLVAANQSAEVTGVRLSGRNLIEDN